MAKYLMGAPEKRTPIRSNAIDRVRKVADGGEVSAFSVQFQHPRFKDRYSDPHFYLKFKQGGVVYTADGASLEALDTEIEALYLQGAN